MNMKYMDIKPLKDRVDPTLNPDLRRSYTNQVISCLIETLKLNFFGIEQLIGLEINFNDLDRELRDLVVVESDALTVLALSSRLVEHQIFEVRLYCKKNGEGVWNPLAETFMCFMLRTVDPVCFVNDIESKPVIKLSEIANWINKKICLQP